MRREDDDDDGRNAVVAAIVIRCEIESRLRRVREKVLYVFVVVGSRNSSDSYICVCDIN